jgi:hypothetical protein
MTLSQHESVDVEFALRRVFGKQSFRYKPQESIVDPTDHQTPSRGGDRSGNQWPRYIPPSCHIFWQELVLSAASSDEPGP